MVQAIWKGEVIAESDATVMVEGNHYFPPASIKKELLKPSEHTSVCSWKGTANYYTIHAGGEQNVDAAWTYATPSAEAAKIKDHVAFWKGVEIR